MQMSDPFASMASCLKGERPVAFEPSVADRAEQLRRATDVLRASADPAARHVATAFETWIAEGGDLHQHLGLRVRRGGAHDQPHRKSRMQARDEQIRAIADGLPKSTKSRAAQIREMVLARDPTLLVIHERTAPVPSSEAQLRRILHGS